MKVAILPSLVLLALAGCGSWQRVGSTASPDRGESLTEILDVQAVYHRLGRLTATGPLPFVGSVAFLGGAGDTTVALIGISLDNHSFTFQKEGNGFVAHYRVELSAQAPGGALVELGKDQTLRVTSFEETQRIDESILFQDALQLPAGPHHFVIVVHDKESQDQAQGRAEGDLVVPSFKPGSFTAPILAYRAKGRASREDPIGLLVNPRGTLSYGEDTALAYVEAYSMPGPALVPLELIDGNDSVVARDTLRVTGGRGVESFVYRFSPDSAPLGELRLTVGSGPEARQATALVSFSSSWVATNFEDMLNLLRYFPGSEALDSLRHATPADRSTRWHEFYRSTDPNPATPANEALDGYFGRITLANQRFRDEGVPGWRTDRGEVLIRIGEPDEIFDASPVSEGRIIRWTYTSDQISLFFTDETGFGRFKLTQSSRSDLERVAGRLSRQEG